MNRELCFPESGFVFSRIGIWHFPNRELLFPESGVVLRVRFRGVSIVGLVFGEDFSIVFYPHSGTPVLSLPRGVIVSESYLSAKHDALDYLQIQ